jgi:hypothetical protein
MKWKGIGKTGNEQCLVLLNRPVEQIAMFHVEHV